MILRAILIAVLAASSAFAQSAAAKQQTAPKQQAAWTQAFETTLSSHAAALPPVKFSPELSVEENNAKLANRDLAGHLLAVVQVHRSDLGSVKGLVGRECSVQPNAEHLRSIQRIDGQVFAFALSPDRSEVTLYIRVSNQRDASGAWLLAPGYRASLRVAASQLIR